MQRTLITVPTHRGITHQETKESIRQLCLRGAELLVANDISDIAGGRSWLLSTALRKAEAEDKDVILMVDDDITFTPRQAEVLVSVTRDTNVPSSGVYPTRDGNLTAMRWRPFRWLVGLGFAAITTKRLRELADSLRPVRYRENEEPVWPFCESHACYELGMWLSEDYDFSAKLGGFQLVSIPVGHLKVLPLTASKEDVDRVCSLNATEPQGGYLGFQYTQPTKETSHGL